MQKSKIFQLGNEVIDLYVSIGHYLKDLLNPGLSQEEVENRLSFANILPENDICDIFTWRNGSKSSGLLKDIYFLPAFYLLDLESAIRIRNLFVNRDPSKANWFPVLSDGGGGFYVLRTEESGSRIICTDEYGEFECFQNFEALLGTILIAIRENVIFVDQYGLLTYQPNLWRRLGKDINPEMEYWNYC